MRHFLFLYMLTAMTHCVIAQGTWTRLDTSNTLLERNTVNFLAFNTNGDLWTATEFDGQNGHGLLRYDGYVWTHYDVQDLPALTNGVRCAVADAAGNMWFAIHFKGLVKFDGTSWTVYNTWNSDIPSDIITAVSVDENGDLWLGTWYEGLSRFDGTTWTTWALSTTIPMQENHCINAIEFFDGKVFLALDCGNGLAYYDLATESWGLIPGLPHSYVSALKNDGQGKLFVGYTFGGTAISSFDGSNWTHESLPPYHMIAREGIEVDQDGQVWFSSIGLWSVANDGVALYGPPLPPDAAGFSIAIGPDGSIWWAEWDGIWTNRQLPVAINEQVSATNELVIQPNPAAERISIAWPGAITPLTVRVFNAHGALVREFRSARAQVMIERDGLPSGAYSVIAIGDSGEQVKGRLVFE
jgi:ligand-binding sensor domain-containing protein